MSPDREPDRKGTLFIACGALGRELIAVLRAAGLPAPAIACLPAHWHNTPERITPAVRDKIRGIGRRYERIFVLYGDCGTGGELDRMLEQEGGRVERIPGPHCYQFFMGSDEFARTAADEPGCLYLTDYLVRHFDRLIIAGLGLDRHPELRDLYFGNYTRLIYIAQTGDERLRRKARAAAARLGLAFEVRYRGYGELAGFVQKALAPGEAEQLPPA